MYSRRANAFYLQLAAVMRFLRFATHPVAVPRPNTLVDLREVAINEVVKLLQKDPQVCPSQMLFLISNVLSVVEAFYTV